VADMLIKVGGMVMPQADELQLVGPSGRACGTRRGACHSWRSSPLNRSNHPISSFGQPLQNKTTELSRGSQAEAPIVRPMQRLLL
jgi:hypothetical protein